MSEATEQAAIWDRWAGEDVTTYGVKDPQTAADFLAPFAATGPALELGPGVGLVAMELARRGATVTGLEISPQMAEQIEQSRGDLPVTVQVGDMAAIPDIGPFALIYATNSTMFSLLTQQRQLDCFAGMARVLAPQGRIVLEAFAPHRQGAVTHRQNLALRALGEDLVDLSATIHDPATQRLTFREIRLAADQRVKVLPVETRYIWPSEMDLMARLAGLTLIERFNGYARGAYSADSVRHVSVYGRPQ
ncbi:class I SAM-dependent methyltransferase [Catellatospora sp. NPDC049133]|uniref:class I SAM-dependent methyltransferase n=1 Tax=Catellatospora sp. NPDC049133 TaxID=3155499 RepID=UPI0033ECB083